MKFPLSWFKEYLPTQLSPVKIAETLTLIGLEVEDFHPIGLSFKGIVVGQVVAASPHPDAQKLTIAKVTDGKQDYQVVCGAPNCREGLKVAFALPGAQLTGADGKVFQIKKAKLRGVESEGMLCSHEELGLPLAPYGKENGIMELPSEFEVGTDLNTSLSDILFEVALTPNLSHCSSLIGIARELAAITQEPLKYPSIALKENGPDKIESLASVTVEAQAECPRYACRILTNVKVGPSPDWLKNKIELCGMRSINNVVDATNFVLLEMGHPLHAFDFQTLQGGRIVVRNARHGEKITTLDGKEHFPTEETLLICDSASPLAIAGVMGSQHSEVTEKTQTVLLESAYFESRQIRRTCKRMGILTEASRRFERGTDPLIVLKALDRATALIQEVAGGDVAYGTIDKQFQTFPERTVSCRLQRANQILGTQLAMSEVETIFKRLGFSIRSCKNETITVAVPSFRHDVQQEIDLIEEVARLYGYDSIHQQRSPAIYQGGTIPHNPLYLFEKKVRSQLLQQGLQEFLTCNLVSPTQANLIGKEFPSRSLIKLLNPSSIDQSVLRPSLFPTLLQVVKHNQDHEVFAVAGFEIGRIHFKAKDHYLEPTVASLVLAGKRAPHHWQEKPAGFDFFDLKGMVENLLEGIKIPNFHFSSSHYENFHPGRQARILVDAHEVGVMGEVHPKTLLKVGLHHPVFFAELNMEDLIQAAKKEKKMRPLPQYPASSRDWTLTLREDCPLEDVLRLIQEARSSLLEDVTLFDIYRSEKLGTEWKNATLRFVYRDPLQTVSFETVEEEHSQMISIVLQKLQEQKKVQT